MTRVNSMPEWAVAAIIVAVLLCVGVVILVTLRVRKRRFSSGTEVPVRAEETPDASQIPIERQPVAPADQAEGFGWMKASDLANQKNKP